MDIVGHIVGHIVGQIIGLKIELNLKNIKIVSNARKITNMCKAEVMTFNMKQTIKYSPKTFGQCSGCNGFLIEKDENCINDDVIYCIECESHNIHIKSSIDDHCMIINCDFCNNNICAACDNIGDCVKCEKSLCDDCTDTFWCYECENGFCYDCEEIFSADDGIYCKPCAIKLNKEEC